MKGKIERSDKSGKYTKLNEITDLSGIRVVAFLKNDCEKIFKLVKENFLVDEKNSVSKEDDIDPDRFGYQSIHVILSYNSDRLKLPEFKRFSGLKFELQIKTILQHTWSAIDWKLRYKKSNEAPRKLRRRLFRISALLDAADDELSFVYDQVSNIRAYYENAVKLGDLSLEIDRDSLIAYAEDAEKKSKFDENFYAKMSMRPSLTKKEDVISLALEKLLNALKILNIKTLRELEEKIFDVSDAQLEKFSNAVESWLAHIEGKGWGINPYDMMKAALIVTSSQEIADKILDVAPFNPILTAKMKLEMEIVGDNKE